MARRRSPEPSPHRVEAVPLPAARVLAVGPDDPAWGGGELAEVAEGAAFVRIRPPPGADEASVEAMRARFRGARAVRVDPHASKEVVPQAAKASPEAAPRRDVREVVRELVSRSAAEDREALQKFVDERLDEAGA